MLVQPSNITPDEVNNTGTVDLTQGLTISWIPTGGSAMVAYQITIYTNDVASTQLYTTDKVTLSAPFWGVDAQGNTQQYSAVISAAALSNANITNSHEYKFLITQWWNASDSVTQTTASVFVGRTTPIVTITAFPNPMAAYKYDFTGTYTQNENDTIEWLRWQIAVKGDNNARTVFYDTGKIYGTGEIKVSYAGFLNGTNYSIKLDAESSRGQSATSGWTDFAVTYQVGQTAGAATACQMTSESCVLVSWSQIISAEGYVIYRKASDESLLRLILETDNTANSMRDYSACSGKTYVYYVFPTGQYSFLEEAMLSNGVSVQFWAWSIIEARDNGNGNYTVINSYRFKMGADGGVKEGAFSNNNSPAFQENFTKYPTKQPKTTNYISSSVTGYIGSINYATMQYYDTLDMARELRYLSTTENTLFLTDPKGHFTMITISEPVTMSIDHAKLPLPQTMTIPWLEIGDSDGISLTSDPSAGFWPPDAVIFTHINLDPKTGTLIWVRDTDYKNGSILSLVSNDLIQTVGDGFTPADMTMQGGVVTASITVGDTP